MDKTLGKYGFKLSDYDFNLPEYLIAQKPANLRDQSKLLVYDHKKDSITHTYFYDIAKYFTKEDLLILNNSKVIPARLFGVKENGGQIDVVLVEELSQGINFLEILVMTKFSKLKIGYKIIFTDKLTAIFLGRQGDYAVLRFNLPKYPFYEEAIKCGKMPLPPYIKREADEADEARYQTIYAEHDGSIAAPTAGLHFTDTVFKKIEAKQTMVDYVTLHVGMGTFKPIKTDNINEHKMLAEEYQISQKLANKLKSGEKRVTVVGTTSTRTVESFFKTGKLSDKTNMYIFPGHEFFINRLITNFHVPHSTPLMLVAAFLVNAFEGDIPLGVKTFKRLYQEAIRSEYRFYSYGDSMFII
ncbi:MAG: tRNA preQ1(34) S-adenosylmethionine ribosyltransferase-isomerase QueA [bacterium]|nr:tRNA preQ1(34) S-adenosylmethionine ribosyltransferase-isomerase QueA [bacterium]